MGKSSEYPSFGPSTLGNIDVCEAVNSSGNVLHLGEGKNIYKLSS